MATTATVARNLLKNSKSLPQILRSQILGRSNATANLKNIAKDHHQIVQSLFVSSQKIHAQIPIFGFTEVGSLVGSHGGLSLEEKTGGDHGMGGLVVEARGNDVVDDEDGFDDDEDDEEDVDEEFDDEDDSDDDDDGDDGGQYKNKF
ncbi:phosphopantothenoylcysteine decarboxylase subunit VHS3-like [Hibiscus syriacus]|uniref:phosphopantothenoylcysteine decarboxylase subunit VHS3-like n=1 Tax=Hibiscus syriacus TaxID=106335 RepID=UPI001922A465|nr:phosphopantothenoylcysteine decarboxylase subunit VHS3-like [Hibiscus syriacus]